MTKEDKLIKKQKHSYLRSLKNRERNKERWKRNGRNLDCPFDVEMNNIRGSCGCGGVNYKDCLGDI